MTATNDRFDFKVEWLPFLLDPSLPEQGIDKMTRYKSKFGNSVDMMIKRLVSVGEKEGIKFSYGGKIANTFNSHRLIHYSNQFGKQDEIVNVLFRNYFEEEKNVGDLSILVDAAKEVGLDEQNVRNYLTSEQDKDLIKHQTTEAIDDMGVTGVPFFILNNRYAVSGAQESSTFVQIFEKLEKEQQ